MPSGAITLQIDEEMSRFQKEELVAAMVELLERKVIKDAPVKRSAKAATTQPEQTGHTELAAAEGEQA